MILVQRLLSAPSGAAALLAVLTFGLGLGIGSGIGPVTASRSEPPAASAAVSTTVSTTAPAAATAPSAIVRGSHSAEVLRVLDGDTFEARVHLWPGLDITTRVRLRDIDAPELNARCNDERFKAEAARDALRAILARGDVGIMRVSLDKYGGRVLADASAHQVPDIAASLLNAGYVRRYYPGSRRDGWCS